MTENDPTMIDAVAEWLYEERSNPSWPPWSEATPVEKRACERSAVRLCHHIKDRMAGNPATYDDLAAAIKSDNNEARRRDFSPSANLDAVCREIESLGAHTPEYHDATAFLLTVMAKRQWIIADQIRRSRRDSAARRERAAARKAEREAGRE